MSSVRRDDRTKPGSLRRRDFLALGAALGAGLAGSGLVGCVATRPDEATRQRALDGMDALALDYRRARAVADVFERKGSGRVGSIGQPVLQAEHVVACHGSEDPLASSRRSAGP
jgi:hypothetical protein